MASFNTGWITATEACVSINTYSPLTIANNTAHTASFWINIAGATVTSVSVDDSENPAVAATATGATDPVLGAEYDASLLGWTTAGTKTVTITVTDSNTVDHVFTVFVVVT